jgi:DNA polymerase (family 10)
MHTKYSDGEPEVEDYAAWAAENSIEWMGIADHSQAAAYAGGLSPKAVQAQWREIDAANAKFAKKGVRLLKGIESDILPDGSLDYDEELLKGFEYVVASVHSNFNFDEAKQTKRIRCALESPYTTILGHMTGRLLLRRDGYAVAQKEIIQAAGELGVIIEINADPHRLDVDWRLLRFAQECGCLLSLGPDAHAMAGLDNVRYGLGIARKGWVEKERLVNCLGVEEFLALARKRRGAPG